MKAIIQRVLESSITVDNEEIAKIGKGLLVLLGITHTDTETQANKLIEKIAKLRIFEDEGGKTNLSIADINGELLVVSQFTLYADTAKGNRPSFINAAKPEEANKLYNYFVENCVGKFSKVEQGRFGADMKVSLINDGPFTIEVVMD